MLLTFAGCSGKKNPDPKPTPTPAPTPDPAPEVKVTYVESSLGNYDTLEKLLKDFNDGSEWNAFFAEEVEGVRYYDVFDSKDVYQGNFSQYLRNGVDPKIVVGVILEGEGRKIRELVAYMPYQNIKEVQEDEIDDFCRFSDLLIKALLPDLSDSDLKKLADKIYLTDAEGYKAYIKNQANPAEFTETWYDVKEKGAADPAFKIGQYYDGEYKSMIVHFKQK